MTPETINTISVISAIVSITLAIIAVLQGLYYYEKSKETQKELTKLLAGMTAQNGVIEKVTSNLLNRALKTISSIAENSDKGPADQVDLKPILAAITELKDETKKEHGQVKTSDVITNHLLPNIADPLTKESLQFEAISGIGQIFIFSGLTNIYSQYLLPPRSELEIKLVTNPNLNNIIQVVDASFQTCQNSYQWLVELNKIAPNLLKQHNLHLSLLQYEKLFNDQLRNSQRSFDYWETLNKKS